MDRWDDLKFLLAIFKNGTMASAARALGTNPATVSRRMERLGDELGVPPVIKTPQGWGPNPELAKLIEEAENFHQAILRERSLLRHGSGRPDSEITIACSPLMSAHIFIPNLVAHAESLANIRLVFRDRRLIESLADNDVIVSMFRPATGRVLSAKVGAITLAVYRHAAAPSDSRLWVGLGEEVNALPVTDHAWQIFGQPPQIRVGTFEHIQRVMETTHYGGILPCFSVRDRSDFVAVEGSACETDIFMSYHESRRGDPAMETVTRFIRASFLRAQGRGGVSGV
ncbi:LysR family transcriptional regulator [Celeribacter indicus]|uniref:LysR family transcriptional regulator n=1 Tax=Celeribacter indicus TaxID=1208324 RepID=A0A0B5E2Q7_9RHOB|nr:LysR family transcriptional regulator [Celeribacter indicus]AJE47311.1 LysR family transcriptional regulator [Celeribacter indicus]SDW03139.1 DNA-binding transcriptional regulator, LysR family [Celeribacter indicus]